MHTRALTELPKGKKALAKYGAVEGDRFSEEVLYSDEPTYVASKEGAYEKQWRTGPVHKKHFFREDFTKPISERQELTRTKVPVVPKKKRTKTPTAATSTPTPKTKPRTRTKTKTITETFGLFRHPYDSSLVSTSYKKLDMPKGRCSDAAIFQVAGTCQSTVALNVFLLVEPLKNAISAAVNHYLDLHPEKEAEWERGMVRREETFQETVFGAIYPYLCNSAAKPSRVTAAGACLLSFRYSEGEENVVQMLTMLGIYGIVVSPALTTEQKNEVIKKAKRKKSTYIETERFATDEDRGPLTSVEMTHRPEDMLASLTEGLFSGAFYSLVFATVLLTEHVIFAGICNPSFSSGAPYLGERFLFDSNFGEIWVDWFDRPSLERAIDDLYEGEKKLIRLNCFYFTETFLRSHMEPVQCSKAERSLHRKIPAGPALSFEDINYLHGIQNKSTEKVLTRHEAPAFTKVFPSRYFFRDRHEFAFRRLHRVSERKAKFLWWYLTYIKGPMNVSVRGATKANEPYFITITDIDEKSILTNKPLFSVPNFLHFLRTYFNSDEFSDTFVLKTSESEPATKEFRYDPTSHLLHLKFPESFYFDYIKNGEFLIHLFNFFFTDSKEEVIDGQLTFDEKGMEHSTEVGRALQRNEAVMGDVMGGRRRVVRRRSKSRSRSRTRTPSRRRTRSKK